MKTTPMTTKLYKYVKEHCPYPHMILDKIARETAQRTDCAMQIPKDQGAFLCELVHIMGAKNIIEIGRYTGYSAICLAQGMASDGVLHSIDNDPVTTEIAENYFAEAGLTDRIKTVTSDALNYLDILISENNQNTFDLMFIDGDKESYIPYYEKGLALLRHGGVIVADNVIWGGAVIDQKDQSSATQAIREFNEHLYHDDRVTGMMLHIADGMYVVRKN
tara:strand:- start:196 stop:852 length:657 start_codon:yes stop_codon:yes gene_type:complete